MAYTYDYPRPMVTVDLVVVARSRCLMVQRGKEPFKDMWALPGGFLNEDETTLEAAIRELKEETGYGISDMDSKPTLLGVYDSPDRDPRGRVISVAYMVKVTDMRKVVGADDAKDAGWRPFNAHPLAFDHARIIYDAWLKL